MYDGDFVETGTLAIRERAARPNRGARLCTTWPSFCFCYIALPWICGYNK